MYYNGYEIEITDYGYSVFYCGDEFIFATENDARDFIDSYIL